MLSLALFMETVRPYVNEGCTLIPCIDSYQGEWKVMMLVKEANNKEIVFYQGSSQAHAETIYHLFAFFQEGVRAGRRMEAYDSLYQRMVNEDKV